VAREQLGLPFVGSDTRTPEALKVEHKELHADLVTLTKMPGKVGEAARNVATLLHPYS
jgi:hypothetical protein